MKFLLHLTFVFCAIIGASSGEAASRPNILLIFADDLGINDLSCYGSEIKTPHIDSLARNGVKLEQFYVATSICTPSRFALLTGRYPNRSKDKLMGALMFLQERDDRRGIRRGEGTIAALLKQNGYRTALIGKWHLGHGEAEFAPTNHGFDYAYGSNGGCVDYFTMKYGYKPDWHRNGTPLEETGYSTDLITDDAVRYLSEQNTKQPFFLFLSYTAPHYGKGWDAETKQLSNILQAKPEDRKRFAHITDTNRLEYAAMVAAMDDGVGRVLQALKRQKLDKDTLVIFTSDNGGDPRYGGSNQPFRGQKAQLFEGGIRVPCLMRWPGRIKSGKTSQQLASALDFFPTFSSVAGISKPTTELDGINLAPALLKGTTIERDLLWQLGKTDAYRRGPWKYLRTETETMLFNLKADQAETTNLAEEQPDLVAELKAAHADIAKTFRK